MKCPKPGGRRRTQKISHFINSREISNQDKAVSIAATTKRGMACVTRELHVSAEAKGADVKKI